VCVLHGCVNECKLGERAAACVCAGDCASVVVVDGCVLFGYVNESKAGVCVSDCVRAVR